MNPKPAKTPRASAVKKMPNKHKAVLLMRAHSRFPMKDTTLGSTYWEQPVWVLPATPEAYEAQVEALAKAIDPSGWAVMDDYIKGKIDPRCPTYDYQTQAREAAKRALAAIGIRQPRPARSRK